ncbi:hypothetical protein BpHYR1_016645 [Brachionus plicatilis]|uniref:Uncharacterized protein n=1 Tax=Brachionus plicatilis TaxID=10195 RepID=A0A3M7Q3Y3_BRAPC|nr:hypothetical protein BpHYR1_016645 [Brachionus plicatilis]
MDKVPNAHKSNHRSHVKIGPLVVRALLDTALKIEKKSSIIIVQAITQQKLFFLKHMNSEHIGFILPTKVYILIKI